MNFSINFEIWKRSVIRFFVHSSGGINRWWARGIQTRRILTRFSRSRLRAQRNLNAYARPPNGDKLILFFTFFSLRVSISSLAFLSLSLSLFLSWFESPCEKEQYYIDTNYMKGKNFYEIARAFRKRELLWSEILVSRDNSLYVIFHVYGKSIRT